MRSFKNWLKKQPLPFKLLTLFGVEYPYVVYGSYDYSNLRRQLKLGTFPSEKEYNRSKNPKDRKFIAVPHHFDDVIIAMQVEFVRFHFTELMYAVPEMFKTALRVQADSNKMTRTQTRLNTSKSNLEYDFEDFISSIYGRAGGLNRSNWLGGLLKHDAYHTRNYNYRVEDSSKGLSSIYKEVADKLKIQSRPITTKSKRIHETYRIGLRDLAILMLNNIDARKSLLRCKDVSSSFTTVGKLVRWLKHYCKDEVVVRVHKSENYVSARLKRGK